MPYREGMRIHAYTPPTLPAVRRHKPVVIDGVTLDDPKDDAERVLGEGRGTSPGRRAMLWGGIGAFAGALPGVGVFSTMAGMGMAARGMDQRDNPDGMPLITPLLGLGTAATMLAGAVGFAAVGSGHSAAWLLPQMGLGAVFGGLNFAVAGYHGRNWY